MTWYNGWIVVIEKSLKNYVVSIYQARTADTALDSIYSSSAKHKRVNDAKLFDATTLIYTNPTDDDDNNKNRKKKRIQLRTKSLVYVQQ